MKRFNEFGIKVVSKVFIGAKIKIHKVIDKEIIIHDWKIEDSTVKAFQERGSCKCLHLQISINNEMHVLFTSAGGLIEAIQQVPKTEFPFATIIIKENDRFLFT